MAALSMASLLCASACGLIIGDKDRSLDDSDAGGSSGGPGGEAGGGGDGGGDAPSCNADLATDAKNCGACGHDCLGGACAAGVCGTFTVASGLSTPDHPVVVDRVAYWTSNDGSVFSCPVVGCTTPTRLMQIDAGNPLPYGLDIHNGVAYVIGYYSQSILSCKTSGCAGAPTTVVSGLDYPSRVYADDTNVYFLNANTADIERCDLPVCTTRTRIALGIPAWFTMTTDDTEVYWVQNPNGDSSNGTIYKAPKTQAGDAGGEVILTSRNPADIAVKSGVLYMTENGNVTKITLAPGLPEFPLANGQSQPAGIAVDDANVYWATLGDGAIRRCPQAGCSFMPTTVVSAQNTPMGPYVTADAIYWTEFNGGTFRGIAK
jgi:hypothetical protein